MYKKVLISSNQPIVSSQIKGLILKYGVEKVEVANSIQCAIEKAEKFCPDLIICDIYQGKEHQWLDALKKVKSFLHTEMIVVSSLSDKISLQKIKRLRLLNYLIKPFDINQVALAIKIAFNLPKTNSELGTLKYTNVYDAQYLDELTLMLNENNIGRDSYPDKQMKIKLVKSRLKAS